MAFSTNGPKGLSSEINVTPLIDVLLVLLIIFMIILPQAPFGLPTVVPTPGNPNTPTQAETPVVVQMDAQLDGDPTHTTYRIDGTPVDRDAVDARLRDLMASRAERQILIRADASLDFGTVSTIVDEGRAAGAETVGLLTPAQAR